MSQLRDRVALVTGASAGIGAGFASMLASEGGRVVLAARRNDASDRVATSSGTSALGLDRGRMPMKPQSAEATAAEALAALVANRSAHLSGRLNRVIYRLVPATVTTRLARSMVRQGMAALARS